ncbi:MAG: Imm50 family immunity protein [Spirochaetales bacterium]
MNLKLLEDFFGEIPNFHDDDISYIAFNDGNLRITIKTKMIDKKHNENICKNYDFVTTTLLFKQVVFKDINIELKCGFIIGEFNFKFEGSKYKCQFGGILGELNFECSDIVVENILGQLQD